MSSKLNLAIIVVAHLQSLRISDTNKISPIDLFSFVIVPFLAAFGSYYFCFTLTESATNSILTAVSVFTGLLINVLILIFSASQSISTVSALFTEGDIANERKFLEEISANISFCTLVGMMLILLQLSVFFFTSERSKLIIASGTLLLLSNFVLTMLMVLKRIYTLLMHKLNS